jgi:hypothetical protein
VEGFENGKSAARDLHDGGARRDNGRGTDHDRIETGKGDSRERVAASESANAGCARPLFARTRVRGADGRRGGLARNVRRAAGHLPAAGRPRKAAADGESRDQGLDAQ